jgi:hypothetical protein
MHYLPNHTYDKTASQSFHIEISYSGNDSMLNILKGVKNPTLVEKVNYIRAIATTGSLDSENKMPIELTFVESKDKDGNPIIPPGTKMLGTAAINKMPVFDK